MPPSFGHQGVTMDQRYVGLLEQAEFDVYVFLERRFVWLSCSSTDSEAILKETMSFAM